MIAFVILHYQAETVTSECIDTLEKTFDSVEHCIVVVDNASPNGSGERLKQKYAQNVNVHFVLNNDNLGFANGNNVGYKYAKPFNPDYIVIMNSDVFIEDSHFLDKIEQIYSDTHFCILGPDIVTHKFYHQSPIRMNHLTLDEIDDEIIKTKKELSIKIIPFYCSLIMRKVMHISEKLIGRKQSSLIPTDRMLSSCNGQSLVLQGACYIFSRNYFEKENNAFNPKTFLYYEEDLLSLKCLQKNYSVVYDPSVKVIHIDGVSTKKINPHRYAKYIFIRKNLLKSLIIYKKTLEDGQYDY